MVKKGLKLTKEQLYSINKASIKDAIIISAEAAQERSSAVRAYLHQSPLRIFRHCSNQ